jgi:DNA mismatch repair protein MSH4
LLSESVSVLDMIVNSFAHLITIQPPDSYSRPEFTGKLWARVQQ